MFKYITEILSQFNVGQRVFVLFQLLFFISLIYLIPKLIDTYNPSNDKLETKITNLEEKINYLEIENDDKSSLIRQIRLDCTNQIVEREQEFIQMLTDLEVGINRFKSQKVNLERRSMIPDRNIILDTVQPQRKQIYIDYDDNQSEDYVLDKIKTYKSKISN